MKIGQLVDLFDMNSKDIIEVVDMDSELAVFLGRVDYLQFPFNKLTEDLREFEISLLESDDILKIYVVF